MVKDVTPRKTAAAQDRESGAGAAPRLAGESGTPEQRIMSLIQTPKTYAAGCRKSTDQRILFPADRRSSGRFRSIAGQMGGSDRCHSCESNQTQAKTVRHEMTTRISSRVEAARQVELRAALVKPPRRTARRTVPTRYAGWSRKGIVEGVDVLRRPEHLRPQRMTRLVDGRGVLDHRSRWICLLRCLTGPDRRDVVGRPPRILRRTPPPIRSTTVEVEELSRLSPVDPDEQGADGSGGRRSHRPHGVLKAGV